MKLVSIRYVDVMLCPGAAALLKTAPVEICLDSRRQTLILKRNSPLALQLALLGCPLETVDRNPI